MSPALLSDMLLNVLQGPILQAVAGCLQRLFQRPALRSQVRACGAGSLRAYHIAGKLVMSTVQIAMKLHVCQHERIAATKL